VNKGETINRLERLLQRVRLRAAQPRTVSRADAGSVATKAIGEPTSARPRMPSLPTAAAGKPQDLDSEERLVAVQSEPAEEPTVVLVAAASDSIPPIEVTEVEIVEEEEEEEEAPISSRRTVASQPEERLADMAFGGEEPRQPLHTPPPESGRLPAAPAVDFDPDVTGVRNAAPIAEHHQEPESRREFVPEPVRAQLSPNDRIAEMIAKAQSFAPQTFVALLDASVSL
jgi:hypothetical protein